MEGRKGELWLVCKMKVNLLNIKFKKNKIFYYIDNGLIKFEEFFIIYAHI